MGHIVTVLTFPEKTSKKKIQEACDNWANANADLEEQGYVLRGLGSAIDYKSSIFDTYDEAYNLLMSKQGNYHAYAVRYRNTRGYSSKTLNDLARRIQEYNQRIQELNKPHYMGKKIKTIKCKNCGAVLPTEYCGVAYVNNCPVCRADLRPATILEKEANYKQTLNKLQREYRAEEVKISKKQASKAELYWAVLCEVHS